MKNVEKVTFNLILLIQHYLSVTIKHKLSMISNIFN